jgi:hypothetical protein
MLKKKIEFKTKDFSIIAFCLLVATAIAVGSNLDLRLNGKTDYLILGELKMLVQAQKDYKKANNTYASSIDALDYKDMIEQEYPARAKEGYEFRLEYGGTDNFSFTANPKSPSVSKTYYFVDETGEVRYNVNSPANAKCPPING